MFIDELYIALVISTVAHAKLTSINASEALSCPGVKDFISAQDVPGSNVFGFMADDKAFADEEVSLGDGKFVSSGV